MEIKILVPENRKEDLEVFIKTCEKNGMKVINQGGGRMPNFSGYYATLKGDRWIKSKKQTKPSTNGC
jgi:uncharacterized protein YfdQ (DUF2303 family)